MEADRVAIQQLTNDGETFIHPPAPSGRVHPADRDFVPILPAHPDTEDEPSRSEPGEVSELACHQHRMAQRQQVDANVDGQRRM